MTLGLPRFDPLIVSSADMRVSGVFRSHHAVMADSDATGRSGDEAELPGPVPPQNRAKHWQVGA